MTLISGVFPVHVCAENDSLVLLKICPVFLSPIVPNTACRCFGRQGPWLPPSSSLMRLTLSPVKEEGTVRYFSKQHRNMPRDCEMNDKNTVPAHLTHSHFLSESSSGDCSLSTTATVHCLLFSAVWSFIVQR